MEKRILGRSGLEVGAIGLGVEHMTVSRANMEAVFDLAVPAGANVIDLLYNDPADTHASIWNAMAPVLRRHRDRLVLVAHWGFVYHEPMDHCRKCLDQVLGQLGNGYAEVAMLTMVDTQAIWESWAQRSIETLRRYQREGRVGWIGMSGHDVDVARTAVESGLIDVLMFPVNLFQHHGNEKREALLASCSENEVGVVAMKPYHGGRLLSSRGRATGITPVQCLHYVLSQPVSTIVPGARDAGEMRQALAYLDASEQEKRYAPLHEELKERLRGECTQCQHCLPCPQGIPIHTLIWTLGTMEYYGHGVLHDEREFSREKYAAFEAKGSDCTECGVCLERCPFGVDIIGKMRRAVEVFETRA